MKRGHQKAHRLIWFVLTPAIAAIIYLALANRPAEPLNDALPSISTMEAN